MFRKTITHIAIIAILALAAMTVTATSALAGGRCIRCDAPVATSTTVAAGHTVSFLSPNSSRWP